VSVVLDRRGIFPGLTARDELGDAVFAASSRAVGPLLRPKAVPIAGHVLAVAGGEPQPKP